LGYLFYNSFDKVATLANENNR